MRPTLRTRLLGAIEGNSLMFLCGAGVSVSPPSNLPLAGRVAQVCYDAWLPNEPTLDPAFRTDIDRLAAHFHASGNFHNVFIGSLVPWNDLVGYPNRGHAAVADLLTSHAAHSALSANFDTLIEHWAKERKVAMQGALDGVEASSFAAATGLLVKFHGCMDRDRTRTLWTTAQLSEPEIQERVRSCSAWMGLNIPGKDLVVAGFWTDWGYLNDVLARALAVENASSVTVVDPSSSSDLEAKAPRLWAVLNDLSLRFEHVRESSDDVLEELRTEYSRAWARKYYALGGSAVITSFDTIGCDDLYNIRRDAEAVPYSRAATQKAPPPSATQAATAYSQLLEAGATQEGPWLRYGGRLVRVVNGGGRRLPDVEGEYVEPSGIVQPDIVVCAGADDVGVPSRVIAAGYGMSVVRPAPGGGATWLTLEQARREFSL